MSETLHHECGIAALYWLDAEAGAATEDQHPCNGEVVQLMPSMLLDLQNRGQLAAGMSSYNPDRDQILDTYKRVGAVNEAFRMSHPAKHQAILENYAGKAAIGHTRYATCGADDVRHAQPFERHHGRLWKWYSFAFNGNLANFKQLRDKLLSRRDYHFSLNTDTEIIMHALSYRLRGDHKADLARVMYSLSREFDGAFNISFLDALGRMFVARDPLGLRPLSYAVQGRLFAAASESVALMKIGISPDNVRHLAPGEMAIIEDGKLRIEKYARKPKPSRCFFEWVYFSNVASEIDDRSVYQVRARSGQALARMEDQTLDEDCVVVPVPDTAKAAGDAFAYALNLPSMEGLMRNRYIGRTFIQPTTTRKESRRTKYTPLPSVLKDKRVFLVEDSIVRSTTLTGLARELREIGQAREIHVRVACPPIYSPCFYGIDMSTINELFAPEFLPKDGYDGVPSDEALTAMAERLGIDSLRYLPVPALEECINVSQDSLCLGCVMGKYPSTWGNGLYAQAKSDALAGRTGRTYE